MGLISSLLVRLGLDSAQFETGIKRSRSSLYSLSQSVESSRRFMVGLAKAAVVAGGAYGITRLVKSSIDGVAQIGHLSTRLGIATDDLMALEYAAARSDVEFGTLTASIGRLMKNLQELRKTKAGIEMGKLLGLDISKLAYQNPARMFEDVVTAINKLPSASQRAYAAFKLFGRGGVTLLQLRDMKELTKEAKGFGYALSAMDVSKLTVVHEQIIKLKFLFKTLANAVTVQLAPAMFGFVDVLIARLPKLIKLITDELGKSLDKIYDMNMKGEKALAYRKYTYYTPRPYAPKWIGRQMRMYEPEELAANIAKYEASKPSAEISKFMQEVKKNIKNLQSALQSANPELAEQAENWADIDEALTKVATDLEKVGQTDIEKTLQPLLDMQKNVPVEFLSEFNERLKDIKWVLEDIEKVKAFRKIGEDIQELMESFQEQIATFGMEDRWAKIYKLGMQDVTTNIDNLIRAAKQLDELDFMKKMGEDVAQWRESHKTAFQKALEDIKKYQLWIEKAGMTQEEYNTAMAETRKGLVEPAQKIREAMQIEPAYVNIPAMSMGATQHPELQRFDRMLEQGEEGNKILKDIRQKLTGLN